MTCHLCCESPPAPSTGPCGHGGLSKHPLKEWTSVAFDSNGPSPLNPPSPWAEWREAQLGAMLQRIQVEKTPGDITERTVVPQKLRSGCWAAYRACSIGPVQKIKNKLSTNQQREEVGNVWCNHGKFFRRMVEEMGHLPATEEKKRHCGHEG